MAMPNLRSRLALILVAILAACSLVLGYLVLAQESGVDADECQAAVAYFQALEGLRKADIGQDEILGDEWVNSIEQMIRECQD